jgi:hypothetical protein
MKPIWIWRSHTHPSVQIGAQRISPVLQSIGVRWHNDGFSGGFLWQFPRAVHVEDTTNGEQSRISIPDPTRTVVWSLIALAIVFVVATTLILWRSHWRSR